MSSDLNERIIGITTMRRKAQVTIMPAGPMDKEADIIQQFLAEVAKMGDPIPEGGPVPGGAQTAGVNDELALSEIDEHVAFTEVSEAIKLLENAIAALREHERIEKEHGTDSPADKKESKAITKLEKALDEVVEACQELCEAEEEEHEEKEEAGDVEVVEELEQTAEAVAAKEEPKEELKEEEKKEEKKASLKVRNIVASKKEMDIDDTMLRDLV